MNKSPITVYYSDRGEPEIYKLTAEQIEVFQDNDWTGIEKFRVPVSAMDSGYAPAWLIELSNIYGFEVESI